MEGRMDEKVYAYVMDAPNINIIRSYNIWILRPQMSMMKIYEKWAFQFSIKWLVAVG